MGNEEVGCRKSARACLAFGVPPLIVQGALRTRRVHLLAPPAVVLRERVLSELLEMMVVRGVDPTVVASGRAEDVHCNLVRDRTRRGDATWLQGPHVRSLVDMANEILGVLQGRRALRASNRCVEVRPGWGDVRESTILSCVRYHAHRAVQVLFGLDPEIDNPSRDGARRRPFGRRGLGRERTGRHDESLAMEGRLVGGADG